MSQERAEWRERSETHVCARELEMGATAATGRRETPRTWQGEGAPERQRHERRLALGQERAGESHDGSLERSQSCHGRGRDGTYRRGLGFRPGDGDGSAGTRAATTQRRCWTSTARRRRRWRMTRVTRFRLGLDPLGGTCRGQIPRTVVGAFVVHHRSQIFIIVAEGPLRLSPDHFRVEMPWRQQPQTVGPTALVQFLVPLWRQRLWFR